MLVAGGLGERLGYSGIKVGMVDLGAAWAPSGLALFI